MDIAKHHEGVLDFTISPDLLSAETSDEIALTCTITNLQLISFRMRKDWDFTRPNALYGTLRCDITVDGRIYEGWKDVPAEEEAKSWSPDDVIALKQGESHTFEANLTRAYPLLGPGYYTLQAVFIPSDLKGVRVSKCKPVYSNLITIVID